MAVLLGSPRTQVSLRGCLHRQAFSGGALDMDAAHHFILGAPRPIFGISLGAEGLGRRRPTCLSNNCFPGA